MRATIIAPGSRGDIQPYLAIGVGLMRAGHVVRVVTTMDHDALVRSFGLELSSVPLDVQAALQTKTASSALEGGGLISSFREFRRIASIDAALRLFTRGDEVTCDLCGDGLVQADLGEECDEGDALPTATCDASCQLVP
jgi:hypothetical protein